MLDFTNFRGKLKKRPLQENLQGKVVNKKVGRPKKPNNVHLHLMMDAALKKQLQEYATNQSMDVSALVSSLVRIFFAQKMNKESRHII